MKKISFFLLICFSLLFACKSSSDKTVVIPKPKPLIEKEESLVLKHLVQHPIIKSEKPPVLILLHGLGSNEKDLFSFARKVDKRLLFISPRAPYPMSGERNRWYQGSYSTPTPVINLDEVEASRKTLIQFIDQIVAKYNADPERVYLGGFSQGAIMSLSVGLTAPDKVKGIAAFSGRVIPEMEKKLGDKNELKELSVFLSHGTQDQVLKYEYAESARDLLNELGADLDFKSYDVKHSISQENLFDFLKWLNDSLKE